MYKLKMQSECMCIIMYGNIHTYADKQNSVYINIQTHEQNRHVNS